MEATEKTNCVVDFIDESVEEALRLRSLPVDKRGPLHGLPISLKENIKVKGYDHTIGLAILIGQPEVQDGELVKALKEFGAIPFCLTNLPQSMMSYGCSNPIFGRTSHPKDTSRQA